MAFAPLGEFFPEVADRETRSVTVPAGLDLPIPPGDYAFMEMYCNERRCDCRRVLLYVIRRGRDGPQAVITWGWEDVGFYQNWLKHGTRSDTIRMKGPALNPGSAFTKLAPYLLEFVRDVLLTDSDYVERIKRHYRMVRQKVDQPRLLPRSRRPIKPRKRKPKKRP